MHNNIAAIDIGGTKTLVAIFDSKGKIVEQQKFPTPQDYEQFVAELADVVAKLSTKSIRAFCVAAPGVLDRKNGKAITFGNLPWKNVSLVEDIEKIVRAPGVIENDAKLAGLSEATLLLNKYKRSIYVTISTGIGIAVIDNGTIDEDIGDRGGKAIILEHNGKLVPWESFASGKAIVERYGKRASEINDPNTWKAISRDLVIGFIDLIAVLEPEVIIVGGGVGTHLKKYKKFLLEQLKIYETPMMKIPPIVQAKHPEEAVIYGCYQLAKKHYGPVGK